jgi:hypothetical protein
VDEGVYGWTRCTISVKTNGNIKSGAECEGSDGVSDTLTGGSFAITKSCIVTGEVTSLDGDSVIDHARFDLSRAVLTGVGHDVGGDNFTFTMLRQ